MIAGPIAPAIAYGIAQPIAKRIAELSHVYVYVYRSLLTLVSKGSNYFQIQTLLYVPRETATLGLGGRR